MFSQGRHQPVGHTADTGLKRQQVLWQAAGENPLKTTVLPC
jgi:hypothetical protein